MPTLDDFAIVHGFYTRGGTTLPSCCYSYDNDLFLRTFFQQPPLCRMIYCAMAAYSTTPVFPEAIQLSYYRRSRKALTRALGDKPTHQTVQALLNICLFALCMNPSHVSPNNLRNILEGKGQPDIGQPFFQLALDLIVALKLDIDPDDSPWLYHLNLTARQKEDRRRAFWPCFWYLCYQQAVSNVSDSTQHLHLNSNRIKPPSPIYDPYPIFDSIPLLFPQCELYKLIHFIKQQMAIAPSSIQSLLTSEKTLQLHSLLISVHSKLPTKYLLICDKPYKLSLSDQTRFMNQISEMSASDTQIIPSYNLDFLASISVLNRPILFLSSCQPHKLPADAHAQTLIQSAINQCIDSAFRISCFLQFYIQDPGREENILLHTDIHPIFEAMIVFWFVTRRMDPKWWPIVSHWKARLDWCVLKHRVVELLDFVKSVYEREGSKPGVSTPILTCMEAMFKEMEVGDFEVGQPLDQVEEVVLGMQVASLDDSTQETEVREPHCFLGLLGMDVGGKVRWMGPSEESWRLFWKLNA